MIRATVRTCGLLLLVAAAPVLAQDSTQSSPSSVKLSLDLGLVNAAGNTRLTSFNLGDNLEFKTSGWKFIQTATVVYGRSGDSTTAEQYKFGGRADHTLFFVIHGFVGGTYERNTFAGIERRLEGYAGLGVVLLDVPTDALGLDLGSALNRKASSIPTLPDVNFASLKIATNYRHYFNKTAYFSEVAEILPGLDGSGNMLVNSETILVAPVSDGFALKMSYLVKYDKLPEPGFQTTDRLLSSGVQITF
jgi:putative salt-induced outer membrane protein YdiY